MPSGPVAFPFFSCLMALLISASLGLFRLTCKGVSAGCTSDISRQNKTLVLPWAFCFSCKHFFSPRALWICREQFGFAVSSFGFSVSSFGFAVSSFGFAVSSFGFAVRLFGFAVSLFGFAVRLFGFAVRLFGFAVRLFGFAVRLFGFAVSNFVLPRVIFCCRDSCGPP